MKKLLHKIINLFKRKKKHYCILDTLDTTAVVRAKPKYINTAKHMKGKMILRYDVYCTRYCSVCNKPIYTEKIHKNVTSGFLLTRFGIKI